MNHTEILDRSGGFHFSAVHRIGAVLRRHLS